MKIRFPNGTHDIYIHITVAGHRPSPELTVYDKLEQVTGESQGQPYFSLINSTIINPPQVYQPAIKVMGYDLSAISF